MSPSARSDAVHEGIRLRLGATIVATNMFGGLLVFLLLVFALPGPKTHDGATLKWASTGLFLGFSAVVFPLAWSWSARSWRATLAWTSDGRKPDERERLRTLRFPLTQQLIVGTVWLAATVIFTAVTAPFSLQLASNVLETVLLGGVVSCALGYLLSDRLLRPVLALALADGPPARPQLPGVAARTLLTWTLGTGVILFGIGTIALAALSGNQYTLHKLAVVILVLAVAGLLIGLLMMIGLARSLADPIAALRRAMGAVEQGELDHHVTVDDGSEIGLLQAGFNEGWVNKFEGDAALCVFGAPLPDAHAAAHALRAARELRARLARESPPIAAGIGVSAGRVVAGNIGAARRFEYTVIGDPVNEAARLTEMAKRRPERLLASQAAVASAGTEEAAHWLSGEQVTLRGRSRPTELALPGGSLESRSVSGR